MTNTDMLPPPEISDYCAPYVCENARVNRFEPWYKYVRNERRFSEYAYIEDEKGLPMSALYYVDDSDYVQHNAIWLAGKTCPFKVY